MNKPSRARAAQHVQQVRALEGQWKFTSLETDGAQMPVPSFPAAQLLIDGDRFRMESPEAIYEGVFIIDVDHDPPHIDFEFVEGPEAGERSYGIYALKDNDLTICLGLVGSPRPKQFETTKGSGHALERFSRVSSTRPKSVAGGKRKAPSEIKAPSVGTVDPATFNLSMTPLLEQLQGEWLPVSLVTNGVPLQPAFLAYGSRTQTGNETKVVFGGQTMVHALMRLDESASPIAVDYLNIGKGPHVVSFGILDWSGGEMRVCMAKAGEPRPSDFSSGPGSGRTLSTWRRK